MNCERWSAWVSAMKAVTQIGNASSLASRIAALRCWPSTMNPGLSGSSSATTGMVRVPERTKGRRSSVVLSARKRTRSSNAMTMALGNSGLGSVSR